MSPPDDRIFSECGSVRCTPQALQFIQDRRVYREIPLAEIRRVTFRHGYLTRRPLAQLIMGSIMALFGLLAPAGLTGGLEKIGIGLLLTGGLGIWLFVDALKKGFLLRVEKIQGWDQCGFAPKESREAIAHFLAESKQRFGLPVESTEPVR